MMSESMKYGMMLGVMLCMGCSYGQTELQRAINFGAEGKITFRVVDSAGSPVEGAAVKTVFIKSQKQDYTICEGLTDTNGLFVAEGKSYCDMNYRMSKDGYYQTDGRHFFYSDTPDCVENGRWQPWNPTNTVVLKEKRNPIPMYTKAFYDNGHDIPAENKPIGFDMEMGDWVAPYGTGKTVDILFTYKSEIQSRETLSYELTMTGSGEKDGFICAKKDSFSKLQSTYLAPKSDYEGELKFRFGQLDDKILINEKSGDNDYYIFRVRTRLDRNGNIIKANYGKIYGHIGFGPSGGRIDDPEFKQGFIRFNYYFNPNENDRNIEFDPSKELLNPEKCEGANKP